MSNKKALEVNLWGWLKVGSLELGHDCHLERIDARGRPDIDGCYLSVCFQIETKTAHRPIRPETPIRVKFEPGQIPWMKRRLRAGGNVWILLQVGSGPKADRLLIPAEYLNEIEQGATLERLRAMASPAKTAQEMVIRAAPR